MFKLLKQYISGLTPKLTRVDTLQGAFMPANNLQQKPVEHTLPIDDNTLFILLALRYCENKTLELNGGLDAIYDWDVNYNNTLVETLAVGDDVTDYANAALKWIENTFSATSNNEPNKLTIILEDKTVLINYLQEYLKVFHTDKYLYFNEERHKRQLFNFIVADNPDFVKDFNIHIGKYFTYKYLPENNPEKYKMIEYIGYLINKGILFACNETFECKYQETGEWKKSIRLRFIDEKNDLEFLKEFLDEHEQQMIQEKLDREIPDIESCNHKWRLYKPKTIRNSFLQRSGELPPLSYRLFKYCIEKYNKQQKNISIKEYAKKANIAVSAAKIYISGLNSTITKALGTNIKVIQFIKTGLYKITL